MGHSFLVVGGGVIGLSTAYHLQRDNPDALVTLVEAKSRTCSGNSAKSAALYRNLYSSDTARALSESSISYYLQIADRIALKPSGYLWTFTRAQWRHYEESARALVSAVREARILGRPEILDRYRFDEAEDGDDRAYAAILGGRCGSLSAQLLGAHYEELFLAAGGILHRGRPIAELRLSTGAGKEFIAAVDENGESLEADTFIIATGCWLQDLLGPAGIASGVYAKKRQLFTLKLDKPELLYTQSAASAIPPNIILPSGGVYLKPVVQRGCFVVGRADDLGRAFEHPYGPVSAAMAESEYFKSMIEPELRRHFPALDGEFPNGLPLANSWAGHYDYYWPDRNPVIERIANLVWVGGSSGSGIMKADAIGRIAAGKAAGLSELMLPQGGADGETLRFIVDDLSLRNRNVKQETLVL